MTDRQARAHTARRRGIFGLLSAICLAAALVLASTLPVAGQERGAASMGRGGNGTCGTCHEDLEEMHPFAPVTCVQCHGGDPTAGEIEKAHVKPKQRLPSDERVIGRGVDPAYLRFLDPGNLRVAAESCGQCHEKAAYDVLHSLHASTAGHLGDGLYENGVVDKRGPAFSVFPLKDERPADVPRAAGAAKVLKQITGYRRGDPERVSTHFSDLPRKACMQCHLWSRGRAVRGRAGMDGDYRGEGCSACHVPYTDDGLSLSRDRNIDHFEPGHPKEHRMVRFADTDTCTRCHYGDASIGLSFRGLAQPVPGMPQSPDAPGLHRKRLNGMYYIDDIASTPADVHHQGGMHCVDCHTRDDTMGDGNLYTRMEDAIEIQCETCHGTWQEIATGLTKKGRKLPHLTRDGDDVFLVSRVTGKRHPVKQSRNVVRPGSDDFNAHAALAMSDDHARLECYACHSGWNPNFFGFHFDRNEAFTQLDILSGARTQGRVTTQEKVFSTFKHFYLGWNSHGRIAPYMVGFSSMATAHAEDGTLILEQALPVTRAGLSGMTMIHHQTHTTTARARQCVECHRSGSTYGRGTVNFQLARDFAVTGGSRGVRFLSLDRKNPADSGLLSVAAIEDVRTIAIDNNRLTGYAERVYAATAEGNIEVVDARSPGFPRTVGRVKGVVEDAQRMLFRDGLLYVADGTAGLRIFDASRPERPREIAHLPDVPAYDLHLAPPMLYVAAGPKGIATLDVRDPSEPRVLLAQLDLNGSDTAVVDARRIAVLFQYSRPSADKLEGRRTRPRNLAAVGTARRGLWLLDVTEARRPSVVMRIGAGEVRDLAITTVYELGSEGGAIPSQERDMVVWLAPNRLGALDVTDAASPRPRGTVAVAGDPRSLHVASVYNQPFLQTLVLTAGEGGVSIVDIGRPDQLRNLGAIPGFAGSADLALESFPLDRTVDSEGAPIMDVSHEGARWLNQAELLRVLGVPVSGVGDTSGATADPLGGRKPTMTRITNALPVLALLALLAPVAAAQDKYEADTTKVAAEKEKERLAAADRQWERIDKNRDGKLKGDELPAGFVDRFDRDGDNDVEKKEFDTVIRRPQGLRRLLVLRDTRARALSAMRFDQDDDDLVSAEEYPGDRNAFKKADRNKDGFLAWKELLRMAGDELADLRKRMKNPSRYEMLDLFDLNRDQQISKAEYDGPSRAFRKHDANGDGVVDYYEATGRMRGMMEEVPELEDQSVIASMDADDDGKVSREEWKGTEAAWMRMDKNGDGWITTGDAR